MATIIKTIKRVLKIERPPEETTPAKPALTSAESGKAITITRKERVRRLLLHRAQPYAGAKTPSASSASQPRKPKTPPSEVKMGS